MLDEKKLPTWLTIPGEYSRIVDLKIVEIDPWYLYEDDDEWAERVNGLKERFLNVELIPFARRADRDHLACWEKSGGSEKVFVINDYSSLGWKNKQVYSSFWDWFKDAIDEMIEHEQPYR